MRPASLLLQEATATFAIRTSAVERMFLSYRGATGVFSKEWRWGSRTADLNEWIDAVNNRPDHADGRAPCDVVVRSSLVNFVCRPPDSGMTELSTPRRLRS